eukprot:14817017-Alexandrium_andersonii.AAC.1
MSSGAKSAMSGLAASSPLSTCAMPISAAPRELAGSRICARAGPVGPAGASASLLIPLPPSSSSSPK